MAKKESKKNRSRKKKGKLTASEERELILMSRIEALEYLLERQTRQLSGTMSGQGAALATQHSLMAHRLSMSLGESVSSGRTKLDYFQVYRRLVIFLQVWTGWDLILPDDKLKGQPKLGMDQERQNAMKTPLEDDVYADVNLELEPTDIPPLSTVAELQDKVWERIPARHKA